MGFDGDDAPEWDIKQYHEHVLLRHSHVLEKRRCGSGWMDEDACFPAGQRKTSAKVVNRV